MSDEGRANRALAMSTVAFTVCFAAWTLYSVLATFLVDRGLYPWDRGQIGWLIGTPVLTGALMRLPMGVLTDRYGGRTVFPLLILVAAIPMYLLSYADTFAEFLLAGLGFGLSGASFAVGVAYTSTWFATRQQGTALGIFGLGNMGTALTSIGAPIVLRAVTQDGAALEGWRALPRLYAALLVVTAVAFWFLTYHKKIAQARELSLAERLAPLRYLRAWRFGLYYFFTFGSFVALSQWLIPYYVNVYALSVASAGLMAATFSLPSGVVRAFGGWLSDRWGPRAIMYTVLIVGVVALVLLVPPRMDIQSLGQGITAERGGTITAVSPQALVVGDQEYKLQEPTSQNIVSIRLGIPEGHEPVILFPASWSWQEPLVRAGDSVEKGQLIARGVTHIYFQANIWVFAGLVLLAGLMMGMGSAAVYKHISDYFPTSVGTVGGIVGVLGGLGGFADPIIFGYLLQAFGIWTTCWLFLALVGVICLAWMHSVIRRMMRKYAPLLVRQMEETATK